MLFQNQPALKRFCRMRRELSLLHQVVFFDDELLPRDGHERVLAAGIEREVAGCIRAWVFLDDAAMGCQPAIKVLLC
jgi:hypothetical protein